MHCSNFKNNPFYKNIALALIFSVLLGPLGALYSSVLAGTILIVLGIIIFSAKFIFPIILLWLISCIVSVGLAERYNRKSLKLFLKIKDAGQ